MQLNKLTSRKVVGELASSSGNFLEEYRLTFLSFTGMSDWLMLVKLELSEFAMAVCGDTYSQCSTRER